MTGLNGLKTLTAIISLLVFSSCYRVSKDIEPKINYSVQERYLKQLPSPFEELTALEKQTNWGSEYLIGIHFARNLDFYRAITAFRRSEILLPENMKKKKLEMQYQILLCYYLGKRYEEVDVAFSRSDLSKIGPDFPTFHDLLVILYDSYQHLCEYEKASKILELIRQNFPSTYNTLVLSSALEKGDFSLLCWLASRPPERPYLDNLLACYDQKKKSPSMAAFLNALIPGSGYLYIGQRQTALTAFIVNGLFIASSVYFFKNGPIAAGIVTTSLEAGWYIGGIQGASIQAKFYNERLYEQMTTPIMNQEKLFPIFQIHYAF